MDWFNNLTVAILPYFPKALVGIVAKRYIAGPTLESAIEETRKLNQAGAMTTIDLLGEFIREEKETIPTLETYLSILENIAQNKILSNVSLKPTSFGASFDPALCERNITQVVEKANSLDGFVRIDMENHPYTDLTLNLYRKLRVAFPNRVGTVLQAYLKRTCDDVDKLTQEGPTNIRLCKGIYKEPAEIAFKDKNAINENYLKALDLLFSRGAYVGIATHDDILIAGAEKLIEKYNLKREQYEFQMLLGVRSELRMKLLKKGHRLRVYTPFGKDWYPYSIRRLKENPDIVGTMMHGFFKR